MTDQIPASLAAMRSRDRAARRPAGGAGTMPVLSLFLLLLAFFILLNSLARFETTRTQAILGSLYATFNTLDPQGAEREFGSFVGVLAAADALESELGVRLRTVLEAGRFDLVGDGDVVGLELPVAALLDERGDARASLADLADQVAAARLTVPAGYATDVEVIVPAGPGPIGERDPADIARAVASAGTVVRALDSAGIESGSLMAGIGSGPAGRVRVEFRIFEPRVAREGAQ